MYTNRNVVDSCMRPARKSLSMRARHIVPMTETLTKAKPKEIKHYCTMYIL